MGPATTVAVWLLAGDISHRPGSRGAEPADPGLPRTPLGGPRLPGSQPLTRQGTAWTRDTWPALLTQQESKQEKGEAGWPLGRRRRLGPRTAEPHLRPQGPPSLCRPGGLRPGKAAWPALPESAHRTGLLNCHQLYGKRTDHPHPGCAECSRQRKLCGAFTYLTLGRQRVQVGSPLQTQSGPSDFPGRSSGRAQPPRPELDRHKTQ